MTQGQKNVRTIKGPGLIRFGDSFSSALLVGPFFHFFRYKICFVSLRNVFCVLLCVYTRSSFFM